MSELEQRKPLMTKRKNRPREKFTWIVFCREQKTKTDERDLSP
jgi:hypothetical protein